MEHTVVFRKNRGNWLTVKHTDGTQSKSASVPNLPHQLIEHTSEITELYQSAYKSTHSTETALMAVCYDIRGFDYRKGTVLVMIGLSVAFDTINNSILLQRLRKGYGITHSALKWCQFYLVERYQQVSISDHYSQK